MLITNVYPILNANGDDTGRTELITSHGIDLADGTSVVVQHVHPEELGAKYYEDYGEWIIED